MPSDESLRPIAAVTTGGFRASISRAASPKGPRWRRSATPSDRRGFIYVSDKNQGVWILR